ncbi:hypothetical protein PG984_002844 [Apiospora sp. TS-2023a]
MADVLALVVSAAQVAEYCLKLCGLFDQLYHATETSRSYQQRIQELAPLLQKIQQEPSFNTPEILSCTQSLAATLEPFTFLNKKRSRRFLSSIAFVVREKRFSRIFDSIEEKKSTLSLYIANITFSEVRAGLRPHLPTPEANTMPNETVFMDLGDDESTLTQNGETGNANARAGALRCHDDQAIETSNAQPPLEAMYNQLPHPLSYESQPSEYVVAAGPPNHRDNGRPPSRNLLPRSVVCVAIDNQPSENVNANALPAIAGSYENQVKIGAGHVHNGFKVQSPNMTDERMRELSKGRLYRNNIMRASPAASGNEATKTRKYTMHNGTVFRKGEAAVNLTQYKGNVMEADGDMHNGDVI